MKSGYQESLNQYQDLVNQQQKGENLGNNLTNLGQQAARLPEDFQANALLSGLGAGFKENAAKKKREALSPILQQAGIIAAKAAELEAQTQLAQESKLKFTKIFQQSSSAIAELAKASLAGDVNSSNQLAQGIYTKFKQNLGDQSNMGDFSHYREGVIFYQDPSQNVIVGRNILDLMAQSGIKPTEIWDQNNAQMVEIGLSPGAKLNYENSAKMQQLEMQAREAEIANRYAQADQYNASSTRTRYEMNNPEDQTQELTLSFQKDRANKNYNLLEEKIVPRLNGNEKILDIYKSIEKITTDNQGIVGSSLYKRAVRNLYTAFGFKPDIDFTKLSSLEFERQLKPILGAAIAASEGDRLLSKFISLNNNPASIKQFLASEYPKLISDITKDQKRIQLYDLNPAANLFSTNLDAELEKYQNNTQNMNMNMDTQNINTQNMDTQNMDMDMDTQNMDVNNENWVQMFDAQGQEYKIPANQVQAAQNDLENPLILLRQ